MFLEPISTEVVYQISKENDRKFLQDHFKVFYISLSESQCSPGAVFEEIEGIICRCFSGIKTPYHNIILGCPKSDNLDACIEEQLRYFKEVNVPFSWYLDEDSSLEFEQRLRDYGFQDAGVFQGGLSLLDKNYPDFEIAYDCELKLVEDDADMKEFNDLVCSIFGIEGESRDLHKIFLWNATKDLQHPMYHWIAKKQGKVVSALSSLVEGDIVSFWNGASLVEARRQGFCSALGSVALKSAISKGCTVGVSYLTSEGMAFGICTQFGFQSKWRFRVFLMQ